VYDKAWSAFSHTFLARHPHCGDRAIGAPFTAHSRCRAAGVRTRATQVDHIRPIHGDRSRRYEILNLQSLCSSCHARKTATEDGGFGR